MDFLRKNFAIIAIFLLFLILAFFVYMVLSLYLDQFKGGFSPLNADWGTFGDYVGGVLNPVFGFLSFTGLLLTIYLQGKELKEARTQFSRSADAQEKSEKVLQQQAVTLIRQQFESTFFSLLEQHNKALESISARVSEGVLSAVDLAYEEVFDWDNESLAVAKGTMDKHSEGCGHYFRALYQLLKFLCVCLPGSSFGEDFDVATLRKTSLKGGEKMYSNIIRSFLRVDVAQLLAVNCYCDDEANQYYKFKLLVERYSLLEHMPFDVQGKLDEVLVEAIDYYDRAAFGDSDYLKAILK